MSITKKYNALSGFAVSVGHKMLRGGRLSKRGGQVVSFSPHVAELLGSASRAAIGGALVLGSAIIAPSAMALVDPVCEGTGDVVCAGEAYSPQMVSVADGGTVTLDETLYVDVDVAGNAGIGVIAAASVTITGEEGSYIHNDNETGNGLGVISAGQTDIVLATDIDVSGIAVFAVNSAAGDQDLNITLLGDVSAGTGVLAAHSGAGNGHINLILGQGASITADATGLIAVAQGNGNAVITNDGEITATTGALAQSLGGGNLALINNGVINARGIGLAAVQSSGASGDIVATNTGEIHLDDEDAIGISVINLQGGDGNITVNNTAEIGNWFGSGGADGTIGISVIHQSAGDIEVNNDGGILASGNAIDITHQYQGDVVVNLGAGSATISAQIVSDDPDELTGAKGVSVALVEGSVGDVTINSDGSVYGHESALGISHQGTGDINVNVGAPVDSFLPFSLLSAGAAIDALHDGSGDVNVTLGEGAVVVSGLPLNELYSSDLERPAANGIEVRRGSNAEGLTAVRFDDGAMLDASDDGVYIINQGAVDTAVTVAAGSSIRANSNGVYFRNYGTGSLTVDVAGTIQTGDGYEMSLAVPGEEPEGRPEFRPNGGSAIYAVGANQGNLDVTVSGVLDAADTGIELYHTNMQSGPPSKGDILVNIDGGSVFADTTGVEAIHYGVGALDIDNSGYIGAGYAGVDVTHNGVGALMVDNLADGKIGSDHYGVIARHTGIGSLEVTNAGTIQKLDPPQVATTGAWDDAGIRVERESHGDAVVTNAVGGVISGYQRGIDVMHSWDDAYRGDIVVRNAGSIDANGEGIAAAHFGFDDIDIANTGSIVAGYVGIGALHTNAGNIVITNGDDDNLDATVIADVAIAAQHYDLGDIEITNNGELYAGYNGIVAIHSASDVDLWDGFGYYSDVLPESSGNIVINNTGLIESPGDAVTVWHLGLGDIEFTNHADALINSYWNDGGDGVSIKRLYEGLTTVTNEGDIWADERGIDIVHANGGDVSVTNAEGAEVWSDDDDAIQVTIYDGQSDVFVKNDGGLWADEAGVHVKHYGTGDIVVENAGGIWSDEHGIEIYREGDGDVRVTSTGSIYAGDDQAIDVEIWGDGNIDVTVNEAQNYVGSESSAIYLGAYGAGNINLTVTGEVLGDYRAIGTEANTGEVTITNTATGYIANLSKATDALAIKSVTFYDWDSWNSDTESYDIVGSSNLTLLNNGTIIGTVDFSEILDTNTVTFTNTGRWDSTDGVNYMGQGNDSLTIGDGGVWNAAGSTTYFDGYDPYVNRGGFFRVTGGDVLTIDDGGQVNVSETAFIGLEMLIVNGTLNSANGVAGNESYTDGDVVFGSTAKYNVDTETGGISDILYVGGDVTIDGGTLNVTHLGDNLAALGETYTVIRSDTGEVTGTFDNAIVNHTAFLGWNVDYTAETVDLTYAQVNGLDDAAVTPNQLGVAEGLDSLAITNPLLAETLNLSDFAAARKAFDSLSGEIHPAARTALMQDSRLPRNAVLERLQTPQGGAIWGQGFWNTGKTDGAKSGNTAKIDRETWGVIAGADLPLGENAVLGVAGSYLSSDLTQPERNATGKADTIHALGYIGATAGAANFKAGLGYAWGDVETTRQANVGAINNVLTADYDAKLFQAFAEAGVRVALGSGYFEPMAHVTYLKAKSEAFAESGGQAALTSDAASQDNTLLVVGSRFSTAQNGAFSVRGMAGWQHVFGGLVPTNSFNFNGSDSFTVAGVAQSRDAAVVNIEANFDLSSGAALGIGYDAVVGRDSQDHAAKVSLRIKF